MDYMTLREASEKWGISTRQINYYCTEDRILGAVKMAAKCYSGQKISLKIRVKCYNARTFQKNLRRQPEMAVRRVLFCR
jgi:hypothetical protein